MSSKTDRERRQAACILCTLFLVFIIILLLTLYFTLFKPKDPTVQVTSIQLLSFSLGQGSSSTLGMANNSVSLSLNLQISMYNPNRADFYIEQGSTACLFFQSSQIALDSIPSGLIFSQSSIAYSVQLSLANPLQLPSSFSSSSPSSSSSSSSIYPSPPSSSILPLTTVITLFGHVTTANMFSHHSEVVSKCSLNIAMAYPTGSIQSYTCLKSYSLDG